MAHKSKWKRAVKFLLTLVILYLVVWCIGFYRVWSFQSELRLQHRERGEEVERFISKLEVGQPGELVRNFPYAVRGKDKSEYVVWYYDFIQENSSVSNRGGPVFKIRIGSENTLSVRKSHGISHGDKFSSPFHYYPSVAIFGLDTDEYNER